MLFTGHSQHSIDPKLRLAIPAKYRNQWDPLRDGTAWYCIPWPTGHLRLFTEAKFNELAQVGTNSLTPGSDEADLEADIFGLAERLEPDSAGRITIPRLHMELTGLPSEVVIVGARVRLEVHAKDKWEAQMVERFRNLPDRIARVQGQGRRED